MKAISAVRSATLLEAAPKAEGWSQGMGEEQKRVQEGQEGAPGPVDSCSKVVSRPCGNSWILRAEVTWLKIFSSHGYDGNIWRRPLSNTNLGPQTVHLTNY